MDDRSAHEAFAHGARALAASLGCLLEPVVVDPVDAPLTSWLDTFLTLQNVELAAHHGAWLRRESPKLGSLISGRVARALTAVPGGPTHTAAVTTAEAIRGGLAAFVARFVDDDRWLAWPSA